MGFVLYYNLITPYFVRQHYKAVQLKMTVSPTTWFAEKASTTIPFLLKMFHYRKIRAGWGGNPSSHILSCWGTTKWWWWWGGGWKGQEGRAKSTEGRCQVHWWAAPFTNNQILCLTTDIHIHSVLCNMEASSYLWLLFQLTKNSAPQPQ